MMNYLKRIEIKKRPQHFQQGGNIAIGSPKPYTTTLPGVNFNPLTLNNAPIEINTTGISDQINKMRQLAFDREALAFKYKELEYKEGADYLNFMGDIAKSINGINGTVKSAGGVSALSPRFRDILSQQESEKQKLFQDIGRATSVRDFKTAESLISKIGQLHNEPKYLEAQALSKAVDDIFDKANDYGIGTKIVMDKAIRYIQGEDVDIFELIKDANYYKALKVSAKDETKFINDFLKTAYDKAAEKKLVTVDPKTGVATTTTTKERPDLAKVKAALRGNLINMQEGRAILEVRNINPDKKDSADLESFVNATVDAYDAMQGANYAPSIEEKIVDKLLPSYDDVTPGDKKGKQTDADKATEAQLEMINRDYGFDAKNKMENVISGVVKNKTEGKTEWQAIEEYLAKEGFERLDGTKPSAGKTEKYRGSSTGIIPYDAADTEIIKNLKIEGVSVDSDNLAIKDKDGKRYLIVNGEDAAKKVKEMWPNVKVYKDKQDDDVVWKEYGIDPTREDLSGSIGRPNPLFPLSPLPLFGGNEKNTTIFEIENKPKKTSSSYKGNNVDPVEAAKQLNKKTATVNWVD